MIELIYVYYIFFMSDMLSVCKGGEGRVNKEGDHEAAAEAKLCRGREGIVLSSHGDNQQRRVTMTRAVTEVGGTRWSSLGGEGTQ